VMGRYSPPRPARDGLAVTGEAISAENIHAPENLIFAKDSGCRLDPETSEVVAERYGLAEVQDRRPMVAPLVAVANRKMTVKATVYARTAGGEPTTPDHFRRLLEGFGVTASLQEEALEQALEQAGNSGSPVEEVVLARGVLPRNGRHGAFKPEIVSAADSSPGQETDDGRIDYRARGRIRSVRPGDLLGRLIPPEPGVPGLDVFGDLVPAKDGKPFKLTAGENVEVSEDGTEYTSTSEGMVFFVGHTLKVSEVFEINGDVDLAVGNVLLERGSVRITGSVMTGFRVEAPGNVVIGKVVEGATIVAGGDVQVGYGIVGGQLEVGGRISAMYAQNAIMHAHGDVEIAHEINNCTIFTGGKVVATQGRGKVVGGVLNCNEGVMAKEIGSPIGVETFIFLAVDRKAEANLATKKQLEENLKKIYAVVGAGDIKTALEKSPPDKREAVAKVLKARLQCEQELREVEAEIERDREARLTPLNIKVKATVGIHPDVVITCFKAQFRSTTFMSSPTIVYSVAERKLVVA
ncbi:MAG: DUF342 domain-containing protein, partial [Deltaproteobacteria bacterium]|nr:DUF342 domain-containing protein [Deltaproteobacteria bacterium]